jgi:hypothetical protein
MDEIVKAFLENGLFGVVAALAISFGWRMYRDRIASEKASQERIDKLTKDHQLEMQALEQRYITKAETWMQQFHDLARSGFEVADAVERRYGR